MALFLQVVWTYGRQQILMRIEKARGEKKDEVCLPDGRIRNHFLVGIKTRRLTRNRNSCQWILEIARCRNELYDLFWG
ncbi:hypothetical protein M0802_013541 [Mischocyttarus mexicanus]|nr:hypothetical protein M0802_013544 [Mischocyttarus mexicanus]KAI4482979.1 hypothetical protein M0802_013541 [Mischocyttarus mexicanus]